MVAAKTAGKKVVKTIAKKKVRSAPAAEKKVAPKEEEKKAEEAPALPPASKAPAKGKAKAKAQGKAEPEAKAQAKAQSRKTKARRLEEAQARVDAEDDDEADGSAAVSDEPRGVVYVGHIPEGFFEPQMRKYFSQFGKVTRVRHSRSKKNAASKGYGWVEFEEEAVAKIAQQTMDGYLMFDKKLKCEMVPQDKIHPSLFKNANRRMRNFTNLRRKKAREVHNNRPTTEVDGEVIPRATLRQGARRGKADKRLSSILKNMEVKYDIGAAVTDASEAGEVITASAGSSKGKKKDTPSSPKAKAKAAAASSSKANAAKKQKKGKA